MKVHKFILAVLVSSSGLVPMAQEKDADGFVNTLNKTAQANFIAASINLTRDALERKLTIYSFSQSLPTKVVRIEGYSVQIIFRRDLQAVHDESAGSYIQHYHGCLLDFAAAQFAEGEKATGVALTRLLAQADPNLSWSESDDGRLADL